MSAMLFLICFILILLTGILAYRRPRHVDGGLVFTVLLLGLCLWSSGIAWLSTLPSGDPKTLLVMKLIFGGAIIIPAALCAFVLNFPQTQYHLKRWQLCLVGGWLGLLEVLNIYPGFVIGMSSDFHVQYHAVYKLFRIYALAALLLCLVALLRKRYTNSQAKTYHARYLLLGIGLAFSGAVISNLVLPLLTGSSRSSFYGPIFSLLFVLPCFYAIMARDLFRVSYVLRKCLQWAYPLALFSLAFALKSCLTTDSVAIDTLLALSISVLVYATQKYYFMFLDQHVFKQIGEDKAALADLHSQAAASLEPKDFIILLKRFTQKYFADYFSDIYICREDAPWVYQRLGEGPLLEDGEALAQVPGCRSLTLLDAQRVVARVILFPKHKAARMEADKWLWFEGKQAALSAIWTRLLQHLKNHELDRKLAHSDKLITLGQLSASIMHEIKNPLTGIVLNAELIEELAVSGRVEDLTEIKKLAGIIQNTVTRLRENVEGAVRFARKDSERSDSILPAEVIESTLRLLDKQAQKQNIKIETQVQQPEAALAWQSNKLAQVLLNLCLNSFDAMPAGGLLKIGARVTQDAGAWYEITVQDNGQGLSEEQRKQIFEPFVTFKKDGTGLGLAVVKQLIDEKQGQIAVASAPQRGSTFTIKVPLNQDGKDHV